MTDRGKRDAPLAYGLAALVVVLDQGAKAWAQAALPLGASIRVAGGLFHLTRVKNVGVSFALLGGPGAGRWLLALLAACAVAILTLMIARTPRLLSAIAFGLVMGGAIGNNLLDRVRLGYVVDFLDVRAWRFTWIFNLADAAITLGAVLFLIDTLRAARGNRT